MKSDDENEGPKTNVSLTVLRPPSVVELMEDNSLLNVPIGLGNGADDEDVSLDKEIASVDLLDGAAAEGGKAEDQDESDLDDDDEDDDDDDDELKSLKEFQAILQELADNQYAYDKYVRLCELSQ